MLIGGLQKTTLVDYPGKVAATVFTLGCSFRCPFCHNPELVLPELFNPTIPEEEIMQFFANRVGKLEGVCITGGEPTVQKDLGQFMARLKKLGYAVKLDSNGTFPKILKKLIDEGNIDYIAMDIKGPIGRYSEITASRGFEQAIKESIKLIMDSGIEYEFRTTVAKPLHSVDDFKGIGELIKGAKLYYIQNFVKTKQVDESAVLEPLSDKELKAGLNIMSGYVEKAYIR